MFLVTGATGNVGGQLVRRLVAAGEPVRALTRHPERAQLPGGVEVARGDLTGPESPWPVRWTGARGGFLYPVPDVVDGFLVVARGASVRRIVVLCLPLR